ncbi:homeobox protein prospero [Drosophila persimilis]|uniref:homeobox protein prospero n=1 Tax=Drosophila persimilis TaxID=7234 RepID=UPI000F08A7F9|nr:homeobox protein prospero [Drosophila persimilis]
MDECDNPVVVTLAAQHGHGEGYEKQQQQQQQQQKQKQQSPTIDDKGLQHSEDTKDTDTDTQSIRDTAESELEAEAEEEEEEEDAAVDAEVEAVIMGQAESKKHGSKSNRRNLNGNGNVNGNGNGNGNNWDSSQEQQPLHTKGTAMSFGFRKKLNGTPKKFKKLLESHTTSTPMTDTKDDNGNAATTPIHFEKVGAAAAPKSSTAGVAAAGAAGKRFGYRGALPRPASTGLYGGPSEESESETAAQNTQNNNNHCGGGGGGVAGTSTGLVSNLKRRSKSAHAGRSSGDGEQPKIAQPKTLTFNLNQNTTIEYQRRQFFGEIADETTAAAPTARGGQQRYNYNNLASMHANVIVRPTPRLTPASFAKFTLQTVSLPRPEYPVAISLTATTPTTPSSSVQSPVPAHATGARAKDISTSSRQHPLTSVHVQPTQTHHHRSDQRHLDQKSVKQLTNNSTRRGFSGSREISADSGIASLDMALDSGSSGSSVGSKRSRSRPRNLQMVMSGRHTFEVKDVDDPPSSESNSFVEPLALPKLPTDGSQAIPLPLLGLVRSNTVLSRESYERRQETPQAGDQSASGSQQAEGKAKPSGSDESESVDEEKLYLDSSTSEKSAKQQSHSSVSSSWRCQSLAGESLAAMDCSSMSISDTQSQSQAPENGANNERDEDMSLGLDEISLINTDMPFSTISSMTETPPKPGQEPMLNIHLVDNREASPRPRSFNNALNESKFAELALASSTCLLLDDETSPTDSLVSSTEDSEEAGGKLKKHKHKLNEERQQKDIDIDIDDIAPLLELELDPGSPVSPGTPTHASHSLSLGSDCGNLIDDEIADQPALLCNSEAHEVATDTPTLMETHTGSLRSLKSQSKARTALQQAIELSLRTPMAVRQAVLDRAESLDTLSPCESICSDDLMMDFDMNSSVDSIDHMAPVSGRSRSGSDLHRIGAEMDPAQAEAEAELLSEMERNGSDVMKELNSLLRGRRQRGGARERISAQLPARATRLLNRSRLQDQQLTGHDSDNSLRSTHSGGAAAAVQRKRSTANSRASTASSTSSLPRQRQPQRQQQQQQQQPGGTASGGLRRVRGLGSGELHSSSDDLMLYDKSFRNAMIQDVLQFKKQLLRLRRILQETETLNPFENDNLQLFAACGLDSKQLNDIDLASLTSSTTEDPLQELSDLRRQVVYLQGQVDDRDRTIRLQRDLIEQLEAEKRQQAGGTGSGCGYGGDASKELISMATQTERTRPLAIGAEGLSRSKPEYTSYTTHFPMLHLHDSTLAATTIIRHHQNHHQEKEQPTSAPTATGAGTSQCPTLSQTRRHTIISTTLTNYNQQLAAAASYPGTPRRASIGWDTAEAATRNANTYKPVRITLIGDPLPLQNGSSKSSLSLPGSVAAQSHLHAQNGVKMRYPNGSCQSAKMKTSNGHHGASAHYQPLYNSNKMTSPTVTIV